MDHVISVLYFLELIKNLIEYKVIAGFSFEGCKLK